MRPILDESKLGLCWAVTTSRQIMAYIFHSRQKEVTFTHLKWKAIFFEDLNNTREIIEQCWDVIGKNQSVIDDCFTITKYLRDRWVGWYTFFSWMKKNDPFTMTVYKAGTFLGRKGISTKHFLSPSGVKKAKISWSHSSFESGDSRSEHPEKWSIVSRTSPQDPQYHQSNMGWGIRRIGLHH